VRQRRRPVERGLVVALFAAGLVACDATDPPEGRPAPKPADSSVRTDHRPIVRRFGLLRNLARVRWQGGRLGDDRAPGPSTYFIDALVVLPRAEVRALERRFAFAPAGAPDIPARLRSPSTDHAAWRRSRSFEAALPPEGWGGRAHLDRRHRRVFLTMRGGS
jgi:hypothetical protein